MRGDPAFVVRFKGSPYFRTGHWNLLEAYHAQLVQGESNEAAAHRLAPYVAAAVSEPWEILQEAARVRIRFRSQGKNLSNVDAVGYALARAENLPFLTGDPAFKGAPGVDFLTAARRPSKKGS